MLPVFYTALYADNPTSVLCRFIDSLSAKVHSSPPSIEKISDFFQDFYIRADSHIATHISALASRINRDSSPHPSTQGRSRNKQDGSEKVTSSRQMLTASEVTEKRKARKFLAQKQVALEEAVERKACESVYDKIWQHESSLDKVQDERLRSKTAALALVGISMKDLGVDIDTTAVDEVKQKEANDGLAMAQGHLKRMNDEKYPLGKLRHLVAVHKAIVETLTKLLPSTSSADEILPTLIYALITSPTEDLNVVSNLHFIQHFRSSSKMDGETAYCLTNLEAAINFVENVDLPSLRAEETQDGHLKVASAPAVQTTDRLSAEKGITTSSTTSISASLEFLVPSSQDRTAATLPLRRPSPSPQQRRLSNLFQPPSKVFGAANDAVRNTADQSLKNIGATLDSSLNFVLGRLKELQPGTDGNHPILPKTLAEARHLVAPPSTVDNKQAAKDDQSMEELVDADRLSQRQQARTEDRFIGLVSGRRTPRDRSVDSARTQGSSKRSVSGAGAPGPKKDETPSSFFQSTHISSSSSTPTPFESMRNFGNTFNPLSHIPGMIRSFGRATTEPPRETPSPAASEKTTMPSISVEDVPSISSPLAKLEPPIQRFLETEDASDLKISDVSVLLEDYKRLASALFKQNS